MRRISIVLAGFAVAWIAAESRLIGQQQSSSLAVSASVSKNCTITTAPVAFGAYDPLAASGPLNGSGTVTVACTKGAVAKVGLNTGSNADGTKRRLRHLNSNDYLNYELYTDSGHSTVWGDIGGIPLDIGAAPSKVPRPFTVYGQVAAAQDAPVGNYADTVVATVDF